MRQSEIVTHQGSPPMPQHAPMNSLENEPEKTEIGHGKLVLTCSFCKKPISDWIRNDFLRRRHPHTSTRSPVTSQAP